MKKTIEDIAAQVSDEKRKPLEMYIGDPELLAAGIAMAAPVEFLIQLSYEGLWQVAAELDLSPADQYILREYIKLIKLSDVIRSKSETFKYRQQEMFPGGAA